MEATPGADDGLFRGSFSANGLRLVTGSLGTTARIWDISGAEVAVLRGHSGEVVSAALSDDGSHALTTSRDGTVRLWGPKGESLAVFREGSWDVVSAISPRGARVVTASGDTAHLWNFNGSEVGSMHLPDDQIGVLEFSEDGSRILGVGSKSVRVWNDSGTPLSGPRRNPGRLLGAKLTRTDVVVLTERDHDLLLWDLAGQLLAVLHHPSAIRSIFLAQGASRILTTAVDSTIRVWRVRSEDVLRAGEARLVRELTPEERSRYDEALPADLQKR